MEYERNFLREEFPNNSEHEDYEIVHHASWSSYEESGWLFILRKDNQLYELDHMYSVMADSSTPVWGPWEITEDQAIELILEWDEIESSKF